MQKIYIHNINHI